MVPKGTILALTPLGIKQCSKKCKKKKREVGNKVKGNIIIIRFLKS